MNRTGLQIEFPAEWEPQSGVQLTWPHRDTDWKESLEEVTACYVSLAQEIMKRERLLIVCQNREEVSQALGRSEWGTPIFREIPSNDTWARDHGAISVRVNGDPYVYDFTFNGWGLKFAANLDNRITGELFKSRVFQPSVGYKNMMHCVLEGGSIESDGRGTILTTSTCLLSENRNEYMDRAELSDYLQLVFGADRVLWLDHGFLSGDDTDSHVDTLARFCDPETIAYVSCEDPDDPHFEELSLMEQELHRFTTKAGKPYRLIALPMADRVVLDGVRLPATYANFLIINGAVLMPTYHSPKDSLAEAQLQKAFPDREIVGVDCRALIQQHGSLHCVTMQYPEGFLNFENE